MNLNERIRQLMMHLSFSLLLLATIIMIDRSPLNSGPRDQDSIFPREDAFPQMYRKRDGDRVLPGKVRDSTF